MPSFVALLRGINVGGNKKVPMADLKKMLEKMGYKNVKTLLNSGNVVFEGASAESKKLEAEFEKAFGFTSRFIVRPMDKIQKLLKLDPFKGTKVTKDTRLYISFLSAKPKSSLKIPYTTPTQDFSILKLTDGEIISVLQLGNMGTVDSMAILEKEFGKDITTRNWNTVQKIAALA